MSEPKTPLLIMAIDCCPDMLSALGRVAGARLITVTSYDPKPLRKLVRRSHDERYGQFAAGTAETDLLVIGMTEFPVRRIFVSPWRRLYPRIPILVLRRSVDERGTAQIRGEFILSDEGVKGDCRVIESVRRIFPIIARPQIAGNGSYELVREANRIIARDFADPGLNLAQVAREMAVSARRLSRTLNVKAGVRFRQLLARTRIEESKVLLTSGRYSVKEVAALTGFADSHYFSRSFKQFTGLSPSEYRARDLVLD